MTFYMMKRENLILYVDSTVHLAPSLLTSSFTELFNCNFVFLEGANILLVI